MSSELRVAGNGQAAPEPEQPDDEVRMRRALGLASPTKQTGGKPVGDKRSAGPVVVHRGGRGGAEPRGNRVAEAENALAAERLAREQAEARLREAEAALHEAETLRGHAELTRDEALASLAAERAAREAAEQQLRLATAPPAPAPAHAAAAEAPVLPRRRGRPPGKASAAPAAASAPPTNDAPVEWWVPGWKTRFSGAG